MLSGMTVDARIATLDKLRHWAGHTRAGLVADAWRAGNRNVTELARAARCGRDAIYADLRAHNIDPQTDREEPPTVPTTPTDTRPGVVIPVPGWRHPNLAEVRQTSPGDGVHYGPSYQVATVPFRGTEPEPALPAEWADVHPSAGNFSDDDAGKARRWDLVSQRRREIDWVRKAWARARFEHQIGEALRCADGTFPYETCAEVWARYAAARDKLTAAYAALDTTPDGMWRSALLRIVDAKAPATKAAEGWDSAAAKLSELDYWLLKQVGEGDYPVRAVETAATKHGVDISDWLLGGWGDYERDSWGRTTTPAVAEVEKIIEDGDERIAAVRELAGTGRAYDR